MPRRAVLKGAFLLGAGAGLTAAAPALALRAGAERSVDTEAQTALGAGSGQGAMADAAPPMERFTEQFLANQVFHDTALSFEVPPQIGNDQKIIRTTASVLSSGDIVFHTIAPDAKSVKLKFGLVRNGELMLARQEDSVFTGRLVYDENHTGPMNIDLEVDSTTVIDALLPILWSGNRVRNFLEVPDIDNQFMFLNDVPHGAMSREVYWSGVLNRWERCVIYTPPGYMKSTNSYPVLYLQHGATENETTWEYCGHIAYILDNLVAAGKAVPFVIVMNNAMVRYSETPAGTIDLAFEQSLTKHCIPYVESNYRVKTDKWNRAIAGLSMGAYMSSDIGFRHPELFGSIGTFTASMTHATLRMTYDRPYSTVMKDAKAFASNYRVYFRSTTPAEDHMDYFTADDRIAGDGGIDRLAGYHRVVYPQRTTKWNSWRMGLRDYAQLLFR